MLNFRVMSRILITIGLLILFYAFQMDITVPSSYGDEPIKVINLPLQNTQFKFFLLGSLCFFAGIVLFAAEKLKQTRPEEEQEEKKRKAVLEESYNTLTNIGTLAYSEGRRAFNSAMNNFFFTKEMRADRLRAALFVGISIASIFSFLISWYSLFIEGITFWLAFRPVSALSVVSQLHITNILIFTILILFIIAAGLLEAKSEEIWEVLFMCMVLSIPVLISYISLRKVRYKSAGKIQ